jgi:hypothetical protein
MAIAATATLTQSAGQGDTSADVQILILGR